MGKRKKISFFIWEMQVFLFILVLFLLFLFSSPDDKVSSWRCFSPTLKSGAMGKRKFIGRK
jgi:hypothetical protein